MPDRIILLYGLRSGVSADEYEHWIRTEDAPYVESRPGVLAYTVTHLDSGGASRGQLGFDYVEVLDVADAAMDREELARSPRGRELTAQWQQYTERALVLPAREVSSFRRGG